MSRISEELEAFTCANSKFETSRDYISMSHSSLSIEEIISMQTQGFTDSKEIRLRCYKGYQMESDLKDRIVKTFGSKIAFGVELSAFSGAVKGHPDFTFEGYPGDCKTVPLDEHLPKDRVPRKVWFQMQAYMLYSGKSQALVIYESRETGRIKDFWLTPEQWVQKEINQKFTVVVSRLYKRSA